jgi:hypothetical protein
MCRCNVPLATARRSHIRPEPFRVQPDPDMQFFVQPKAEKLVRRGPGEYFIVWRKPDGRLAESRLGPAPFKTGGA